MKRGSDPCAMMLDLAKQIHHKVAPRVQVWENQNSNYMAAVAFTTEDIPVDPKSYRFRHLFNNSAAAIQRVPNRICCNKCADFGHLPKDCSYNGFRCKKCGGPHNSLGCRAIQSMVSCWICKANGDHWSTDCPTMIDAKKKKPVATIQTWVDRVQQQQQQPQQQPQQLVVLQEVQQQLKKQHEAHESNAACVKKRIDRLTKTVEDSIEPMSLCDAKLDQVLQQLVNMQRQINQQNRVIDELRREVDELKKNRIDPTAPVSTALSSQPTAASSSFTTASSTKPRTRSVAASISTATTSPYFAPELASISQSQRKAAVASKEKIRPNNARSRKVSSSKSLSDEDKDYDSVE